MAFGNATKSRKIKRVGWSRFWWAAWDHFKWLDHHSECYQPQKLPKTMTLMKFMWMRQTSSVELNSCCFRYIYQVFWAQPFLIRCRNYKILHHTKEVLKKRKREVKCKSNRYLNFVEHGFKDYVYCPDRQSTSFYNTSCIYTARYIIVYYL